LSSSKLSGHAGKAERCAEVMWVLPFLERWYTDIILQNLYKCGRQG